MCAEGSEDKNRRKSLITLIVCLVFVALSIVFVCASEAGKVHHIPAEGYEITSAQTVYPVDTNYVTFTVSNISADTVEGQDDEFHHPYLERLDAEGVGTRLEPHQRRDTTANYLWFPVGKPTAVTFWLRDYQPLERGDYRVMLMTSTGRQYLSYEFQLEEV